MKSATQSPGPRPEEMLLRIPAIQANPVQYLMECAKQYGDFVSFPVGQKPVFFINHPETIQKVLQSNNRNYTKDTLQYRLLSEITGEGLLTSDGDRWLRQRRLLQPVFARQNIDQMAVGMVEIIQKWVDKLERVATESGTIDIDQAMLEIALEIVGQALFSTDLSGEGRSMIQAVLTALDHIVARARMPLSLPSSVPTPANLRFRRALTNIDKSAYSIIEGRQNHPLQQMDLLEIMLTAADVQTGQPMENEQIRDEVVTLLIAGHETVASALAWTWYLLALNPEIRDRLSAEVDRVSSTELTGILSLPYTHQVFEESLRLYPPAWLITRQSIASDELSGYTIPAKSLIIISPYTIHRHPDFWQDPDTFNPERFDPSREKPGGHKYAYIPFGGGPRLCIGNHFASTEAQLIIALLAQRFQFDLPKSAAPVVPLPLVTLRPKTTIRMNIRHRQ